jgi:hypothetical protein
MSSSKRRLHGSRSYPEAKFESVDDYLASKNEPITRIFDLGEVRHIAVKCGMASEEVRGALKRLGFELIERKSGVKEWKRATANEIRKNVSAAEAAKLSSTNGEGSTGC